MFLLNNRICHIWRCNDTYKCLWLQTQTTYYTAGRWSHRDRLTDRQTDGQTHSAIELTSINTHLYFTRKHILNDWTMMTLQKIKHARYIRLCIYHSIASCVLYVCARSYTNIYFILYIWKSLYVYVYLRARVCVCVYIYIYIYL